MVSLRKKVESIDVDSGVVICQVDVHCAMLIALTFLSKSYLFYKLALFF
jgi:hypothetical protein